MVQLEIPILDGSERLTLNGSVRETYFGWLWVPLSAVDSSPGRRSSPCVAGGSGSCLCCTRSVGSPGSRNDARQTDTTVVMENKLVKYDILFSEIYLFLIKYFFIIYFLLKIG